MAGIWGYPEGASHPALIADHGVAKMSSTTAAGDEIAQYFGPITERLHAVMAQQFAPHTDDTLASMIDETNIFLGSIMRIHVKQYDGWVRDIFPLAEAPDLFMRFRVWEDIAQAMEESPEGVVPPVKMHRFEDYWVALRRYHIATKAKHSALLTAEGLRVWLLKQTLYSSDLNRTFEMAGFDAIDRHPSAFKRQMDAQGQRLYASVAEALTWETETFFVGMAENGLRKFIHMTNQQIMSAAVDQQQFDVIVLPFGARQRLAFSGLETDLQRRGRKAIRNIEGGGAAWEISALPGYRLYEAPKINIVNISSEYQPLERWSTISTYFMIDGRSGLDFEVRHYEPAGELSVKVRDAKTSPSLNRYGYEQALRDCHRFGDDGYLDADAHRGMIRNLRALMASCRPAFSMHEQQDLDPFVWHHPLRPVDPSNPGYHVCELYGDVSEAFRGHAVDAKHGEAFGNVARAYLGETGVAAIDELRDVVARLERPPIALWEGGRPIAAWAAAVAASPLVDGAHQVPPDPPEGIDLPYGYTTIAGVRALALKNDSPGGWNDEAKAMFKSASEAWPHIRRLWALVRRTYPECVLVSNGRFVPAWMETTSDETNAFYSVMANFFDSRVRYPVWWIGGASSPAFVAGDLANLGIGGGNLAALNSGLVADRISGFARTAEGADKMREAYRERIGGYYQRMVQDDDPAAGQDLGTFFRREVEPLADEGERARVAAGVLALAYEAVFSGLTQTLTRALINSWKAAPARARAPPARGAQPDRVDTRLSFHPSVWRTAAARAVDTVAPADPTQTEAVLPETEEGFGFARARMERRGTFFDPLDTQTGVAAARPREHDLGSLSELDEEQMLYPFLYQKGSNIFWKFDEATGTHEQTYYFWHRVNEIREMEPDQYAKLGTLCLLFSRISIRADLACVTAGIPPPDLCFMGVHYAIRQLTQGIVLARGGGAAGKMYYKYMDVKIGMDVKSKEWTSNFDAWLGAAVTSPRDVMFQRDFFPAGHLRGYDTSSVPSDFSVEHVGLDKSLITMYVGSEFTRNRARAEANPFPLAGRFDQDYLGPVNFDNDTEDRLNNPNFSPFPGFWYYAQIHRLTALHAIHKWGASYESAAREMTQIRYHPGIVFMEEHLSYTGKGRYEERHEGSGHTRYWPDNVRDVSEGTHVFYQTELKN